jgi:hypothetical protein
MDFKKNALAWMWWESNAKKFPELDMYLIPRVSEQKNPDNVLRACE